MRRPSVRIDVPGSPTAAACCSRCHSRHRSMKLTNVADVPRRTPWVPTARPRVYLRPPVLTDRTEFLSLNMRSAAFYRGLAAPMTSPRLFAAYVRRSNSPEYLGLLVCLRDDDAILGSVNLSQIVR